VRLCGQSLAKQCRGDSQVGRDRAEGFTFCPSLLYHPHVYVGHGAAMTALARIVPLSEVMRISGHSDPRTAIGYQHSETANLQTKLDALRVLDKTERIQ